MSTHVVIIAGGAGTRFWPAGRRARPKQLLAIAGERTMLAETLARCEALAPAADTWIVTNEIQVAATRQEAPQLPPEQIVAEPEMRNTAAAIGLAAVLIARRDPDAVMVVMPADHVIRPQDVFESTFRAAVARAAGADVLLTLGIQPRGPATGYGYIVGGDPVATVDGHEVRRVESFKEKPDAAQAAEFIRSGRCFWNAGTFVWRVKTLLAAFERHLPGHHALLHGIDGAPTAEEYGKLANVPIDIGILEKADNVEVIPASFEWDDVGSWLAMARLNPRDARGNVVRGRHAQLDTANCIVVGGKDHLVATLGVEDLIVVHTKDATLICPKDRAEEIRALVRHLREQGLEEYL